MSRSLVLIFLFSFCFIINSSAQKNNFITGGILDSENGLPAHDVSVLFFSQKNVVFRTSSDSLGIFKLPVRFIGGLDSIKFTSFTYKTYIIRRQQGQDLYKNGSFGVFKLKSDIVQLGEVKIKADKRYRDTTKIDLSGQKFERSVTIDDMFSTNGFSKDANGQLFYKGKPVSDVLVNGGDFFGKNNKDIYNLLPALALNDIEIVETNIDSTTNTTTLKPTIKVNLKFKEKYNKGKFGNASVGVGTEERYLAGAGLYTYKNKEQISLTGNSNNINIRDIPLADPAISFSANSNSVDAKNLKLTYNNIVAKKLQIDVSANGKDEVRDFTSESERQEQSINQYSKTTNKSNSKLKGITDARVRLNYKIDSLNTVQLTQVNNYDKATIADSLNYMIKVDNSTLISNLSRRQEIVNNSSVTEIAYKRLFNSKKGRDLNVTLKTTYINNKNNELDNVYNLSNNGLEEYYVDGRKDAKSNNFTANADFTEPISNNAYLNIFSSYKNNQINYNSQLLSDSLMGFLNQPVKISNQYFQSGLKFKQTFDKVSFDGTVEGLLNARTNTIDSKTNSLYIFNLNLNLSVDYQINKKRELTLSLIATTNYPELSQLVNFNNSYDLISQSNGNPNLKPEVKNNFIVSYKVQSSSSTTFSIDGDVSYYTDKFGQNINALPGAPQNIYVDNIGHALLAKIGTSLQINVANKLSLNSSNSISYQEQPTIINNKVNLNNGYTINQNINTSKELIKNVFTVSPNVSVIYSKYYYVSSSSNIFNVIYSDKLSFLVAKFKLDLYPLINYSHNINSLTSFSMNGGIKRTIFDTGAIWLQGYDLFNSFKFNNNSFGPNYVQTIKYTNVSRYFILGLSFKFNNIK